MALHFGAAVPARSVCVFFAGGTLRAFVGGFFLGRLARFNADLRFLPYLRRQNGTFDIPYAPARLRHVSDLVCHRGGAFAIPA